MDTLLILLFLGSAVIVLAWGFLRYRKDFEKKDPVISIFFAGLLTAVVVVPGFFSALGNVFDIQKNYLVMSLVGNMGMLAIVLYLVSSIRHNRQDISELTRKLSVRDAENVSTDGSGNSVHVPVDTPFPTSADLDYHQGYPEKNHHQ
ncbi:MAG: DUF2304 family protein [Halobacteria archaeon]